MWSAQLAKVETQQSTASNMHPSFSNSFVIDKIIVTIQRIEVFHRKERNQPTPNGSGGQEERRERNV
jgi:hypothetical protein